MDEKKLIMQFSIQMLKLDLSKQFICEKLSISLPTLNSRIRDPKRWTIDNLLNLKKIGFSYDYYGQLLREFKKNSS